MSNSISKPGQVYWRALKPFCEAVSIYDGPEVFLDQFSRLPPEIGFLFAAHLLDSEVRNGGFHQFFFNSTGVLAPEAYAAFRAFKLDDAAAAIQKGISLFGPTYLRERSNRCAMLESIPRDTRTETTPFTALDELYYDLLPSGRFALAADAYAEHIVA